MSWKVFKDLIAASSEEPTKARRMYALCIYGLVLFPRTPEHIDPSTVGLFERLFKGVNPVPAILAETYRSLIVCKRIVEGRF